MRTKRALYNMISNLILQFVVIVYSFIVPKYIISTFGSDVNGLISSIAQFLSYITLMEAGVGGVVTYLLYKPIANKDSKTINDLLASSKHFFNKVSFLFVLYIVLLCFIYPLIINSNFDSIFTISLIIIISISVFAEYYFGLVYRVYLFADQKKYIVHILSIISYSLNILLIIFISRFNISIQLLKLISALLFVIRPIVQSIYVRKKYNINIKEGNKKYKIEKKWDALAQHIAAVIHGSTDITVLTIFCKISEVSVYAVYNMIVSGIHKIVSIFYDSLSSGFGDLIARKELKKLSNIFDYSESFYYFLLSIIYSCSLVLITPFVSVYTFGINDANYIRYIFGYLIVISQLWNSIRFPYSSITLAAGHYKETKNGAIVECITNISISIILVVWLGLVGVAIGTIVAMFIRTCEFIYHSNKYILQRNYLISIKKILLLLLEITITSIICININYFAVNSFADWLGYAFFTFIISLFITLVFNMIFYRNDMKNSIKIISNIVRK